MRLAIALAIVAIIASEAHADAPPIPQCASHTDMLANLASGYGERRVTDGFVVTEGDHLTAIMELTVNRTTGTWTMLLVDPQSGRTCIPFSGTNFGNGHPVAAKPEKGT